MFHIHGRNNNWQYSYGPYQEFLLIRCLLNTDIFFFGDVLKFLIYVGFIFCVWISNFIVFSEISIENIVCIIPGIKDLWKKNLFHLQGTWYFLSWENLPPILFCSVLKFLLRILLINFLFRPNLVLVLDHSDKVIKVKANINIIIQKRE